MAKRGQFWDRVKAAAAQEMGKRPVADPEKVRKLIAKFGGSESDLWAVSPANGFVRFDGQTVVIHHTGLGRLTVGKGEKRIPVRAITAVQIKPAGVAVSGFIQFSIGGGDERRSKFGRQTWDAVDDENSVTFTGQEQPQFETLRDAIESAIAAPAVVTAAPVISSAPDPLDLLRRLAELRDAGIVSDEEFNAKKAEIMQRL